MKVLNLGKLPLLILIAAAVFVAVVGWATLAAGPADPARSGQPGGIQVTSPAGVAPITQVSPRSNIGECRQS